MVQWISSNDDSQVLCVCDYSESHSEVFQHIKAAVSILFDIEFLWLSTSRILATKPLCGPTI